MNVSNQLAHASSNGNEKPKRPFASIAQAVNAYRKGQPSKIWKYHDASETVVGAIVRWDQANGKEIRPLRHADGKWYLQGMDKPWPLYRLPEIINEELVAVCEGEKCADAGWSIGLPSTTPPHGPKSPPLTDWTPLAGKSIWLFSDNDEPGTKFVESVLGRLGKLEPRPEVRVILLPDLGDGDDLYDFFEQHDGAEPETLLERITAIAGDTTVVDFETRPTIRITGNLREDAQEAWDAIHQANEPPRLFRHGGAPARIEHDDSASGRLAKSSST